MIRTARDPAATPEQLQACAGQGESIDRLLARHPDASAQLLELLSHSSDRATRKAVTLHPNTPKDALLKLAPQFPGDFFQNPAFDWLLIEHPNLMFDIGGGVLKNVLKRAECPQSFMAWAAAHGSEQERLAVAMNPQAQADVLQAIERQGGKAAQAAQQHANHPLASGEGDLESAFRKAVEQAIAEGFGAIQSETSDSGLPTLAQWPALSVGARFGGSLESRIEYVTHRLAPPALTLPILNALAGDANPEVRKAVAANPATPPDILTSLALAVDSDPRFAVRQALAGNPATPADVVTVLNSYMSNFVCLGVAANPNTPGDILSKLAGDANSNVRRNVAANPATPAGILTTLAGDSESAVRSAVAANPAASVPCLAALARDERAVVQCRVAANPLTAPDTLTMLAGDSHEGVRCAVAVNPNTPDETLAELACDRNLWVRRCAAGNPGTHAASLTRRTVGAAGKFARWGAASSTATPADVLTMLADDASYFVRSAVVANSATPPAALRKLIAAECEDAHKVVFDPRHSTWTISVAKLKNAELKHACEAGDVLYLPDRLVEKASSKRGSVGFGVSPNLGLAWRLLGLSHRMASPADLAKRSRSTEWVERMAVARNPNTPPNVIEALRKDPHRLVARQAEANAALKAGATERQSQLLQEMPGDCADAALILEATQRLRKRCLSDLRFYGSRWSRCLAPGQWLRVLDGRSQAQLERLLPDSLKQTMAEPWADQAMEELWRVVPLASVLTLLATRSRKEYVQSWIVSNPNAPVEALTRLAASTFDGVREKVARNPATPAAILVTLASDASPAVRNSATENAANRATTPAARNGDADAAGHQNVAAPVVNSTALAADPATSFGTLATQAGSPDPRVRLRVVYENSTPDVLSTLAGDADARVRRAVAEKDTRADILTGLADDSNKFVRRAVAANSATPPAALVALACDAGYGVRRVVATNPATPASTLETLSGDADADVRRGVALNPVAPVSTLTKLASDTRDDGVREGVALNAATPAAILASLAGESDDCWWLRRAVAANPGTPDATLATLAADTNWDVCIAAASNPNAPADIVTAGARRCLELRRALSSESPSPEQSAAIQSWIDELQAGLAEPVVLKDVSDSEFRLAFDALGLMPPEGDKRAIAKAAKSKDWLERAAATYAAGIQPSLLKVLLEDPVEAVRQCAVARLRVVGT